MPNKFPNSAIATPQISTSTVVVVVAQQSLSPSNPPQKRECSADTYMSAAVLSRRRVPGPSSTLGGSTEDDERPASRNSLQPHPNGTSKHHAGSAFEGGGKVAYDPRDLDLDGGEEARVGGKMPRLTIMEEVLLLGIKDKQVCMIINTLLFFHFVNLQCVLSRDTYHSGTTTSHMRYGGVFSLN